MWLAAREFEQSRARILFSHGKETWQIPNYVSYWHPQEWGPRNCSVKWFHAPGLRFCGGMQFSQFTYQSDCEYNYCWRQQRGTHWNSFTEFFWLQCAAGDFLTAFLHFDPLVWVCCVWLVFNTQFGPHDMAHTGNIWWCEGCKFTPFVSLICCLSRHSDNQVE